jgi:hypothetical protein
MSETNGSSRGGLLKRGLLLAAGAVGVGAAAGGTALARRGDEDPTSPARAERLKLYGRGWYLEVPDRKPGERLRPGERGTVYGELLDGPQGKPLGRFYGARTAVASLPGRSIQPDGSIEMHTFQLPGGAILGMGSELGGESIFTIVGGTGRYAGATGTYVAKQRLRELGGDGTAEFVIDLRA